MMVLCQEMCLKLSYILFLFIANDDNIASFPPLYGLHVCSLSMHTWRWDTSEPPAGAVSLHTVTSRLRLTSY